MYKNQEEILKLNLKNNNHFKKIFTFNNDINDENKKINMNDKYLKTVKIRNTGIDLIRIISMYGIVINHILYHGGGINRYSQYQMQLKILHMIFFWHNNGFILISGIVGYKSNKYSNLLYLWLYVVFYSVVIHIYFIKFRPSSIIKFSLVKEFYPVIAGRYWYFTAYFGMYLFIPSINKGISVLTKTELKIIVITTLGMFVILRDFVNPKRDVFHMNSGFGILWFLTFYITGAYIGKYRFDYIGGKKKLFCSFCLFIYVFSTFLFYISINSKLNNQNDSYKGRFIIMMKQILTERYDSILKCVQSISITLFFLQIKYNKYISKIITFVAPHIFGIYLIHNNKIININIIRIVFKNDPIKLSLKSVIILVIFKALKIFFICIFIDYFRHLLFSILKVRKICIYLEKLIIKILS